MDLTVITPTVPERAALLEEAGRSVARQYVHPDGWQIGWDHEHAGPVETVNRLAERVTTDWLFRLDDDDLLHPEHFQVLWPRLTDDDADIIYTWCVVDGGWNEKLYQKPFDADALREENFIPSAACIRTELWRDLGGYREPAGHPHEDWDFWLRALDAGARFQCVPAVTWVYRWGGWQHRSGI